MFKNKIVISLFAAVACLFVPTIVFGAIDEKGNYYITDSNWTDGKVLTWGITIDEVTLKRSDGTETYIIGPDANIYKNVAQGSAGEIAQYYAQGVSLPVGTYTHIGLKLGSTTTLKGYIQIAAGKYYATGHGDTSYDSAAKAEAAAEEITVDSGGGGEKEYLPEEGTTVVIEDGKSYTFKMLFSICGLELNDETPAKEEGVGLTWDGDSFLEGMLQDKYYINDQEL